MMSFVLMAIVGVTWVLWGYSLSFAPGLPFIGGLQQKTRDWMFTNTEKKVITLSSAIALTFNHRVGGKRESHPPNPFIHVTLF